MKITTTATDDKILWDRLKGGEVSALGQLYERYVRVLYSYGKKIGHYDKLVEDSIQDLFVDLWQSRERLGEVETARFYLFRSLRRRLYKSSLKKEALGEEIDESFPAIGQALSQEEAIILEEQSERNAQLLNDLIRNLPVRQSEALLLYYYQDFTYEEIASLMAINEQSARNLVQRALHKLKKDMLPFLHLMLLYLLTSCLN